MNIELQALRAKVRGFHVAGRSLGNRIRKSKGKRRESLWRQKRQLGESARNHLIAYTLLLGRNYDITEKCCESNRPNTSAILKIIKEHASWSLAQIITEEDLRKVFNGEAKTLVAPRPRPLAKTRPLAQESA